MVNRDELRTYQKVFMYDRLGVLREYIVFKVMGSWQYYEDLPGQTDSHYLSLDIAERMFTSREEAEQINLFE